MPRTLSWIAQKTKKAPKKVSHPKMAKQKLAGLASKRAASPSNSDDVDDFFETMEEPKNMKSAIIKAATLSSGSSTVYYIAPFLLTLF